MRELQPGNTQKNNSFIFCLKLNGPFGIESMTLASSLLGSSQLRADWPSVGLLQLISSRHFCIRDKTALYKELIGSHVVHNKQGICAFASLKPLEICQKEVF